MWFGVAARLRTHHADRSDPEAALGGSFEETVREESFSHDAHALVELADRNATRRVRVAQDLLDDPRDVSRIGPTLLVALHDGDGLLARRSVRVLARTVHFSSRCGEVGLEVARFDKGHMDIEWGDFVRE